MGAEARFDLVSYVIMNARKRCMADRGQTPHAGGYNVAETSSASIAALRKYKTK